MASPFRSLGRIAFLLLVLFLLLVGGVLAWFTSWRSDRLVALRDGSEVIETNFGTVECAVRGEGSPVLVFHAAPGGYDQALLLAGELDPQQFRIIAPSRPGYLRSPLASGLLPEQQADLMVALLDVLGIEKTAVLAFSGGAPAAIQFVLRYPGRVSALVLVSPVTKRFQPNPKSVQAGSLVIRHIIGDIGSWVAVRMADYDPRRVFKAIVDNDNKGDYFQRGKVIDAALSDPRQLAWLREFILDFSPMSPRESGVRNDLVNELALPAFDWARISVPTLVVHGELDKIIPISDSQAAAQAIPGARFFPVADCGHVVMLGSAAGKVQEVISDFLRAHPAPVPQS